MQASGALAWIERQEMPGQDIEDREDAPGATRDPTQGLPRAPGQHRKERARSRWMEGKKAESHEVRRRLLWLLLAAEIGMALAAACVLPLLFVNATVGEGGIVGALFERAQDPWTSSTGIMCLGLFLPIPILLLTLALGVGTYRWLQKSTKGENLQGKE